MTQSLVINGKEYVPSNVLASQCGYSHDYIGKLAREEKILGTQVGRQWFIEPGSLNTYLAQVEIEKKIRKEELRRVRKIEHESHQRKTDVGGTSKDHEFLALAQTAVLLICGGIVGMLGWAVSQEQVGLAELSSAASENVALVAKATLPSFVLEFSRDEKHISAALEGSTTVREDVEIFTTLPQFPPRSEQEDTALVESVAAEFSDDVEIIFDEEGGPLIRPIFKNGSGSTTFLLVPVENRNE